MKIRDAMKVVMEISSEANKFVQENKIWDKNIDKDFLLNKLFILVNIIRFITLLLD